MATSILEYFADNQEKFKNLATDTEGGSEFANATKDLQDKIAKSEKLKAMVKAYQAADLQGIFITLAGAALKIPPPWGVVVAAACVALGYGSKVVGEYANAVFKSAAAYIPAQYADKFTAVCEENKWTIIGLASQDWIVRENIWHSGKIRAVLDPVSFVGDVHGLVLEINWDHNWRLADWIFDRLVELGLPAGVAAGAGAAAAQTEGAKKDYDTYINTMAKYGNGKTVAEGGTISENFALCLERWYSENPELNPDAKDEQASASQALIAAALIAAAEVAIKVI